MQLFPLKIAIRLLNGYNPFWPVYGPEVRGMDAYNREELMRRFKRLLGNSDVVQVVEAKILEVEYSFRNVLQESGKDTGNVLGMNSQAMRFGFSIRLTEGGATEVSVCSTDGVRKMDADFYLPEDVVAYIVDSSTVGDTSELFKVHLNRRYRFSVSRFTADVISGKAEMLSDKEAGDNGAYTLQLVDTYPAPLSALENDFMSDFRENLALRRAMLDYYSLVLRPRSFRILS